MESSLRRARPARRRADRLDVLPTGRNLFSIDPRAVPTRTAFESGRRAAAAVLARHLQDHGEWPRHLVMDLWGSASMRSGGEELAQIFAYLGTKPEWDNNSSRVIGFTILPPAALDHPRIDVTVRISGLFRDVFPAQIALIDQMIAAVAELDEDCRDQCARRDWRKADPHLWRSAWILRIAARPHIGTRCRCFT